MSTLDLARRFIGFLEKGDEAGARSCLHTDAGVWHNFDDVTQSVDENMELLQRLFLKAESLRYEVHRLEEIEGGYLQHHTLHVRGGRDAVYTLSAAVIVSVQDGKIARIQEWIDPSPLVPLFRED